MPTPAGGIARPAQARPADLVAELSYDLDSAIGSARVAARRRALLMSLLFLGTATCWALATSSTIPIWAAIPVTVLLVLHMLASRVAGLRSRETITMLAAQVHTAELAQSRPQRQAATPARPIETPVEEPATPPAPDRVARRAAAVGAQTWEPVPVPPPTYTLKAPAHRPEPAPVTPVQEPAASTTSPATAGSSPAAASADPAAAPAAVSRGALPRRAADIERILAIESHVDQLFEPPKAVNG